MSMHALCFICVLTSIVILILRSVRVTPHGAYNDVTISVMGMGLLMVYTHVAARRLGNLRPKIVSQLKMLRSRAEQGIPKRRLLEGVDDLEKKFLMVVLEVEDAKLRLGERLNSDGGVGISFHKVMVPCYPCRSTLVIRETKTESLAIV